MTYAGQNCELIKAMLLLQFNNAHIIQSLLIDIGIERL